MLTDVTGRDRHLILKALAIAVEAIEAAPERQRPISDQADMKRLLDHMAPDDVELETYARSAAWIVRGDA